MPKARTGHSVRAFGIPSPPVPQRCEPRPAAGAGRAPGCALRPPDGTRLTIDPAEYFFRLESHTWLVADGQLVTEQLLGAQETAEQGRAGRAHLQRRHLLVLPRRHLRRLRPGGHACQGSAGIPRVRRAVLTEPAAGRSPHGCRSGVPARRRARCPRRPLTRRCGRRRTYRSIAEVIGRRLGVPAVSMSPLKARRHFGLHTAYAEGDGPASSTAARELLGWAPAGTGLQEDLDRPEYLTS